jgi:hypothetical protein
MKFVHPEFLWALSLLIAPIIIHLFSFRRYKTLYFSSLQFVQHVEQQNKSTQKLKHLFVLLLRLLTLAFIVLAFAQPYFPKGNNKQQGTQSVLALHIDNSFSMTMQGVDGELLSEAIEASRQLIQKAPLNIKILLSTNELSGVESRLCSKVDALERLDHIKPSPFIRSYDEIIKWQKNNLNNATQSANNSQVQFVYLSDFQKQTHQFSNLEVDSFNTYVPIQFVSQNKNNLSIDSIWFGSPLHKVGLTNELFVKASNHGNEDIQNCAITIQTGSLKRDVFIDIKKNNSAIASISFSPQKSGQQTGTASIADKQFFADDVFYFTYQVADRSSILIINGSDANKSIAAIYRLDPFYNVQEIDQNAFTQGALSGVNLVILNGINDLPSGMSSNLLDFSKNNGTVAIFPGKSTNKTSLNSFLSQAKMPLLSKEISQSARIAKINYKDPFFKGVFEKEKDNLSLPGIAKFYLVSESNNPQAVSIIQLQNGKGLLYKSLSEQQIFLFTSVLSNEYGTFTSDILYTTMLLRIGELSLLNPPYYVTIGQEIRYPIYHQLQNEQPLKMKNETNEFIPEKRSIGDVHYIDLSGPAAMSNLTAGIFEVTNGDKNIEKIAVNYNRLESKIGNWDKTDIEKQLQNAGIVTIQSVIVDKGVSSVNLNIEKPYPYWKIFISFAVLFFITELLVLKLWKNKTKN